MKKESQAIDELGSFVLICLLHNNNNKDDDGWLLSLAIVSRKATLTQRRMFAHSWTLDRDAPHWTNPVIAFQVKMNVGQTDDVIDQFTTRIDINRHDRGVGERESVSSDYRKQCPFISAIEDNEWDRNEEERLPVGDNLDVREFTSARSPREQMIYEKYQGYCITHRSIFRLCRRWEKSHSKNENNKAQERHYDGHLLSNFRQLWSMTK